VIEPSDVHSEQILCQIKTREIKSNELSYGLILCNNLNYNFKVQTSLFIFSPCFPEKKMYTNEHQFPTLITLKCVNHMYTKPPKIPCLRSHATLWRVGLAVAIPTNTLVEQDIAMIRVASIFTRRAVERLQGGLWYHLDIVVIKGQPVVMALDLGYVVSLVWTATQVDHHGEEGVLAVRIIGVAAELQLQGVYHPIRQLLVTVKLLDELEAL